MSDQDQPEETFEELNRRMTPRTRKVRVIETGEIFNSAAACADALGVSYTSLSYVLRGFKEKTAGVHIEYTGEWTK